MTGYIQFMNFDENYVVTVEYEEEENMIDVAKFESTRITSLLDRKIKVKTENRVWDSIREITVSSKMMDET